jgi:hypothetical protein
MLSQSSGLDKLEMTTKMNFKQNEKDIIIIISSNISRVLRKRRQQDKHWLGE